MDQSCLEEEEEEEPRHIFKTYEFGGGDGAGGSGRRSVVLLEEGRDPMGGGEEGTTGLVGKNNYFSPHGISPLFTCGEAVRSKNCASCCCWGRGGSLMTNFWISCFPVLPLSLRWDPGLFDQISL